MMITKPLKGDLNKAIDMLPDGPQKEFMTSGKSMTATKVLATQEDSHIKFYKLRQAAYNKLHKHLVRKLNKDVLRSYSMHANYYIDVCSFVTPLRIEFK